MALPSPRVLISAVIAAFTLLACSGSGPAGASATPAAETQNGEAKAVPYIDARFHYRVEGPGPMTVAPDGTAAYLGSIERLEVRVVTGATAADPAALAKSEESALASSLTGFRLLTAPKTIQLNSRMVTKFTYSWEAGNSPVTGKAIQIHSARYYVARDAATVAVVTYGAISSQFDPQGADDVALTFKWQ